MDEQKPLKIVVIVDPLSDYETEDEAKIIVDVLENVYDIPAKLIGYDQSPLILEETNPDLVVIDYGGISIAGAWDTAKANIRFVCEWADNHPSKALVIWTCFTALVYEDEIKDEFGDANNIFLRTEDNDFDEKLRVWFGIKAVSDESR